MMLDISYRLSLLMYQVVLILGDEYSELVKSEVGVRILPLRIHVNSSEMVNRPNCSLTLHRDKCSSPKLQAHEKISWSTKICFLWKCHAADHAMHVNNCWIGTPKNPVYLITEKGCSQETAILHSPSYQTFNRAFSLGWLSVRETGMTHIHVQCDIKLCHWCDNNCQELTPPRHCVDNRVLNPAEGYDRMWNDSTKVNNLCNPLLPSDLPASAVIFLSKPTILILLYLYFY